MQPTIRATNKKTGEVKYFSVSEAQQAGFTDKQISDALKGQQELKKTVSQIQSGTPELSAEEMKSETAKKSVLSVVSEAKRLFNQPDLSGNKPNVSKDSDLSGGVLGGLLTNVKAALNLAPDAKTYKRIKEGFTASLKEATGDTGVLTDQDYARLANILPNFGDSDESARQAWESIDRILNERLGTAGEFSYIPKEGEKSSGSPDFLSTVFGVSGKRESLGEIYSKHVAGMPGNENMTEEEKKKQADFANAFSEGTMALAIPGSSLKKGTQTVASGTKTVASRVKDIGGVNKAAQARLSAATESTAKFRGSDIANVASEYAKTVDPSIKKHVMHVLNPSLRGRDLSAVDIVRKMPAWSKKAFSTGGSVKASSQAGLYKELLRFVKTELATKAPEVLKAHEVLERAQGITGFTHTVGKRIAQGGAVTVGSGSIYLLAKKLGLPVPFSGTQ